MSIFNDEIKEQLKHALHGMVNEVNILFFTQEIEERNCKDAREFLEEISVLNSKIKLKTHYLDEEGELANTYGVNKIPGIVILDKQKKFTGMRYFGTPGGYEINSFIISILEASGKEEKLSLEIENRIKKIDKNVHIQVFVGLNCPHCPPAVMAAHRLSLLNKKITGDMIDASIFPYLANKYSVKGVPKIIINETYEMVGAQPIENFLEILEKI